MSSILTVLIESKHEIYHERIHDYSTGVEGGLVDYG
jgi:hypothetical protein